MIVWQHVARQRAGDDDRSEFQDNLQQLGDALKRQTHVLLRTVSAEEITASRVEWPGPVIDLFLGLKMPEQRDAMARTAADPLTSARRKCDVDFFRSARLEYEGAGGSGLAGARGRKLPGKRARRHCGKA
jgi:hypothetical protein